MRKGKNMKKFFNMKNTIILVAVAIVAIVVVLLLK